MGSTEAVLEQIRREKAVAVIRTPTAAQAIGAAQALVDGGFSLVEITLAVPDAISVIRQVVAQTGERGLVGAGTVTTAAQAEAVIEAGASFVVSPIKSLEVVEVCKRAGRVCAITGATTTEMYEAHHAGADLIKVFPADTLGGPTLIKEVLGPLPYLRLMPSGGVGQSNAHDYLRAGAFSLFVAGEVLPPELLARGDFAGIRRRAEAFLRVLAKA
ncbi:MAG: bifunctional 4-hydroxy-2-oxoglutarate aldolase/2-dehydro-3-deoxy-phosphogluconate aldolase [Chloroflexi bacterium]|nr:bifunctional 4-hydroxy-2-oxoglutarate aldolase/2-dehydro-3-deoxy-phosphogluconate aldolase [Chloroflexota bacterium]